MPFLTSKDFGSLDAYNVYLGLSQQNLTLTPRDFQSLDMFNLYLGAVASGGGGVVIVGAPDRIAKFNALGNNVIDSLGFSSPLNSRGISVLTGADNSFIFGGENDLSNTIDSFLTGYGSSIVNSNAIYLLGTRLISDGGANAGVAVLGFANSLIGDNTGVYIVGDSNTFDNSGFSSIIGEQNDYLNSFNSLIQGLFNSISNSDGVGVFGNQNVIDLSNAVIVNGTLNNLVSCVNSALLGQSNIVNGKSAFTCIGNNNVNVNSDELFLGNNSIGIRQNSLTNLLSYALPLTSVISAKHHFFGRNTLNRMSRCEPITNVFNDTYGASVNTISNVTNTILTIAIPINSGMIINATINARRTSGTGVGANGDTNAYILTRKVKNVGGVLSVGTQQVTFQSEDLGTADANIIISGTNIIITCLGSLNNNLTWNAIVKTLNI